MTNVASVIFAPRVNQILCIQFANSLRSFTQVIKDLQKHRCSFPRTIIYCRTYQDCSNLYLFFKLHMGPSFTEPVGAPVSLSKFRLVEMFTSCTPIGVKDQIISSFTKETILRVIVSTVAFGMGINCCSVKKIVHFGPPDNIESYIQETDGSLSHAILLKKKSYVTITDSMKEYMTLTTGCKREHLYSSMEGYCHEPVDIQYDMLWSMSWKV